MKGTWIERVGYRITGMLLLLGMSCVLLAQDFPTFKGDAPRTGKGTNYLTSGPGIATLTWFRPNFSDSIGQTMLVDNLMRPTGLDPAYWNYAGTWLGPGPLDTSASAPYRPTDLQTPPAGVTYSVTITDASNTTPIVITTSGNHNLFTGDTVSITGVTGNTAANNTWLITVISATTFSLDTSVGNGTYAGGGAAQARSDYQLAECIASDKSGDPRVPLNPTDTLSTFSWTMRNRAASFYEAQDYAVYVHLPTGPTTIGGVQRFPQRYYVYEVAYAGGTFLDVVDTDITGGGWMRIGNGGAPTNKLFPSDGITPITVTLYNTVPRDQSTGQLTTNPAIGSDDLDLTLPRPVVYADAVKIVPAVGSYAATPIVSAFTGSLGPVVATVGVLNETSVGFLGGNLVTTNRATVRSYEYSTGTYRWAFSPLQESSLTLEMDSESLAAPSTPPSAPFVVQTGPTVAQGYRGANYYAAPVVDTAGTESSVTYAPTLNPASYDIYAWLPGDNNGKVFARNLTYSIHEGGTTTDILVDQSGTTLKGWVRIGTRPFRHDPSGAGDLTVEVTNLGDNADLVALREAYVDAIRFVGPTNLTVQSTPVQTTALVTPEGGGAPVATPVVIVAAENGTIYCLSADGRTDGTTDIIWTYPSTRDPDVPLPAPGNPDTWMDPNLNAPTASNPDWAAIDGVNNVRLADMPTTGFFLSSPVVANIGGADYLFIGARNGRVYCIEMAGRGDMDSTLRKPGTTRRVWTYPDDYPAIKVPSNLGEFVGSVAVATNTAGPTVFVPTTQGRMYALDAAGNATTHVTTTRWTYPTLANPTLGAMAMTPAVDFNKVFVGTHSVNGSSPGQFIALDWDTGALSWSMPAGAQPLSDFNGGPTTVPAADLGGGMGDTVFVTNDNRGLYALDAGTGAIQWESYEPDAPIRSPLTFTVMNVFDTSGVQSPTQVLVAPQSNGKVTYWNAQTANLNIAGGRFAGGFITQSQSLNSSVAVGWNFMYVGDNAGYLYALSNTAGGFPPGTTPPITPIEPPNNPVVADYSQAGVKLIKKSAFLQLRQGTMYYADAIDPLNAISRTPMAFEWGETIYLLIYNFPYQKSGLATPPVINLNFTVGGETIRNVFTESRQFPDISDPNATNSGYGVLSFTIQAAGANALPPGSGQISIGFNTTDTSGSPVNYPSTQTQTVFIANPLALVVPGYEAGDPQQLVGYTNNTSDADNLINGTPIGKMSILGTQGTLAHGQSGNLDIGVVDRSLVELIRGPGRGLQNVRVERNKLQWQIGPDPGEGAVFDPLNAALFPGFEDLPLNYPNNSLDYPDIYAQAVTVTMSAAGNVGNPVQYPVELLGPTGPGGVQLTEANSTTRDILTTVFGYTVKVPRFQPPNEKLGSDLNSPPATADVPAGYSGTYYVYVDTSGNGILDRPTSFVQTDSELPAANREAYRNFTLATSVGRDQRIAVLTPTVDLGSLAEGVGYTPDMPGPANALFDPWTTQYSQLFKPFIVANEGNVNMLNLRLAKATTTDNVAFLPWAIYSASNEDAAYLDGSIDLWSDMDPAYAPMRDVDPNGVVILQKSRVGDRFAKQLTTNPVARPNSNTGVAIDTPRLPTATYPVQAPRVAVTLPMGFPHGTYIGLLTVIDDAEAGASAQSMWQNLDPSTGIPREPKSEPGLRITFKSRETRLTSTFSNLVAPVIDDLVTGTEPFRYGNLQPSGFRSPANGSMVVAMASTRPNMTPATPTSAVVDGQWRIFLSSVQGGDPQTAAGLSPLRDLHAFVPDTTNNRWFLHSPITANGFPDVSLDASIWGAGLVAGTAKYGSPVFPADGMINPYRSVASGMGAPFANTLMAFVGNARVSGGGDTASYSQIFVTPVTVDSSGAVGIGDVYAMTNDPTATKGRPSILQTQNGFVLFYAATVGGRSNIYYVMPSGAIGANQYDGSYFTDSVALDLGEGFESVSSPFVSGRRARGGTLPAGSDGNPVIEITFAGKLHGRPVNEIFYGEIALDANLEPTGLISMPLRVRETLYEANQTGTYLANGVEWDTAATIGLGILRNGTYADIEMPGTRQTERGTGIITFDTTLGGKAYLDPNMGTVRLSGARPPRDSSLQLTYQPKLLRISEGTTAGYATPNFAIDERFISDTTYWVRAGDGSPADFSDPIRVGRYLFTYARAAAGAGQAARPMMKSMRLGIELPLPVYTDADGSTGAFSVSLVNPGDPPLQYFQVDPAKRKVYFTPDDQGKQISITYEAADPGTGQLIATPVTATGTIEMIVERPEELVQLDQATDETNLFMFIDPFDYVNFRRPGLVWLLWSSTRAGAPDIYLQTIAPRFTPLITGK